MKFVVATSVSSSFGFERTVSVLEENGVYSVSAMERGGILFRGPEKAPRTFPSLASAKAYGLAWHYGEKAVEYDHTHEVEVVKACLAAERAS